MILAKTIKGYGLGEAGEGRNITHQRKMNEHELREFRTRFGVPVPDDQLGSTPFFRPPAGSPEAAYLVERRKAMGGHLPERRVKVESLETPALESFKEFIEGSGDRAVSTTMGFARMLGRLLGLKDFEASRADHSRRSPDLRPRGALPAVWDLFPHRPAL